MRILGFSKVDWENWEIHHPKLLQPTFTTIRLPRLDKDYQFQEQVKIVLQPRSKDHLTLGVAEIYLVERREIWRFSYDDETARRDGFSKGSKLRMYLDHQRFSNQKKCREKEAIKFTLRWLEWYPPMIRYSTKGLYALRREDL